MGLIGWMAEMGYEPRRDDHPHLDIVLFLS